MPRLDVPAAIRALLETDRSWSVYALGDLSPGFFEHAEWLAPSGGGTALVMVLRLPALALPVLFALGEPDAVAPLLEEIDDPALFLTVRPEILPLFRSTHDVRDPRLLWRMLLDPRRFPGGPGEGGVRLGRGDLVAFQRLFAGEDAPDFFYPYMLDQGVFFGIREEDELVAVAGTHLVVPEEGVAAIGNVYTRRDRRGRGLAFLVTSAVAAELLRLGIRTIGLNVTRENEAAARVYERLGFTRTCAFYEGIAIREG